MEKASEVHENAKKQLVRAAATTLEGSVLANLNIQGLSRKKLFNKWRADFKEATVGMGDAPASVHPVVWAFTLENS